MVWQGGAAAAPNQDAEVGVTRTVFNSSLSFLAKEIYAPLQSSLSAEQQEAAGDEGELHPCLYCAALSDLLDCMQAIKIVHAGIDASPSNAVGAAAD